LIPPSLFELARCGGAMLTDVKARKAAAAEKNFKLADEKGLFLLVRPNGPKLWRMKYRIAGKDKLRSLAPTPKSARPRRASGGTRPARPFATGTTRAR